jgi:hypothetical protein
MCWLYNFEVARSSKGLHDGLRVAYRRPYAYRDGSIIRLNRLSE